MHHPARHDRAGRLCRVSVGCQSHSGLIIACTVGSRYAPVCATCKRQAPVAAPDARMDKGGGNLKAEDIRIVAVIGAGT